VSLKKEYGLDGKKSIPFAKAKLKLYFTVVCSITIHDLMSNEIENGKAIEFLG